MSDILTQLRRIYPWDEPRGDASELEELADEEAEVWAMVPEDLKQVALFVGYEDTFPHDKVRMLYGAWDIIEWNSLEGTFGQLREEPGYAYTHVIKMGDDTFLDVAGQLGAPGGVYEAVGHDMDGARLVAPGLLELLRQAGSYRS